VKTEKNIGTIAFRFRQVLLYYSSFILKWTTTAPLKVILPPRFMATGPLKKLPSSNYFHAT